MTRKDLSPGLMIAQSAHGVASFMHEYPEEAKNWIERSNYIAVLAAKDESELLSLINKASSRGLKFSVFFEPDLDYAITAVALEPGKESKRLCSGIGLALKGKK